MYDTSMSPEEQRAMYRRAKANGDSLDWDGGDEVELTKLDWAEAAERQGMPEVAAELRAEWEAETEQREEAELAGWLAELEAERELRSQRAKRGAETRKRRQAERAAAVAAAEAILADARRKDTK